METDKRLQGAKSTITPMPKYPQTKPLSFVDVVCGFETHIRATWGSYRHLIKTSN